MWTETGHHFTSGNHCRSASKASLADPQIHGGRLAKRQSFWESFEHSTTRLARTPEVGLQAGVLNLSQLAQSNLQVWLIRSLIDDHGTGTACRALGLNEFEGHHRFGIGSWPPTWSMLLELGSLVHPS